MSMYRLSQNDDDDDNLPDYLWKQKNNVEERKAHFYQYFVQENLEDESEDEYYDML